MWWSRSKQATEYKRLCQILNSNNNILYYIVAIFLKVVTEIFYGWQCADLLSESKMNRHYIPKNGGAVT
jgi:hypothetical protein